MTKLSRQFRESARTLQPWHLEYRVNLPKKGVRWLSGLSRPEKMEDGSILWHGFITDITERKQIEDALKESEFRWKFAIEGSGDGMWDWNIQTGEAQYSKRWKEMLGYDENDFLSTYHDWVTRIHPNDQAYVVKTLQAYLNGETAIYVVECRLRCKNDNYKWILARGMLVSRSEDGKPLRMIGTHTDISERKLADEQRNQLLKIIEDAPDFIAMADMQAHLKYLNNAGARLIGLPDDADLSGLEIKDMHPEWATKRVLEEGIPTVLRQGFWQGETALLHKDGYEIPVSQLLLLHRDGFGNPQLLSTIMRDITVYKQVEQALSQAKASAEALAQSKSEFLATMSHEIRTPMNAIIGLSHLALNKDLSDETRDYLEKINSSSNSLLIILNDILDFSKLDAGHLNIDHTVFSLDEILDTINDLFTNYAEEKNLDFSLEVAPDVPRNLVGDTLRLQQILTNLLSNAVKFTEQGKVSLKITVAQIAHSQARLLFCVTDTGIGMSEEDHEKLFHPFSQVDGSISRRFGGTGLGLAISQNLLQLMGGKFSVESTLGKGSRFSFELVLGMSSLPCQPLLDPLISAQMDISQLFLGTRILVVEDNLINQQVVREFLNLAGITVEIANDGMEAMALLEDGAFDAVLMDMHMPVMDGFEATKLIRSQTRFAELPVIALTAGVTKEERERCMASGMNDFIAKPINPQKLLEKLVRWIKPTGIIETDALAAELSATKLFKEGNLPGFDLHNLLGMIGNNRELAIRLLFTFMESMKNLADEIEAQITVDNLVAAKELIHKIKGASGTIGAVRLHAASEVLEAELKNKLSAATFSSFREAFNQTMSVIAALHQPEELVPLTIGNTEALKRSAAELDRLLKENDFISEALLNTLKPHLASNQFDLFAKLRKMITGLQYGKARKILRQLAELPDNQEL